MISYQDDGVTYTDNLDRDVTSPSQAHRALHLSRSAAAAAHKSYYAHPSLHLHTFLGRGNTGSVDYDYSKDETRPGEITKPVNEPFIPPPPSLDPAPKEEPGKTEPGTEATKEELGGKENAGAPSGLDKGALEENGEAGGTHTSPGPALEVVQKWNKENEGNGSTKVNIGDRPEMNRGMTVKRMKRHLQLM